ncbi:hypothetical protein CHLRE_14g612750v5 [Chlamydomonas reinhardtii]|uniref:Lebercilin domain-containing protein n=1 Tax=Chlamydomonas reinhardtii TaxID=3055 RepID=A0A2K3CXC7_CHLRE|nr:uncharacterized protein CHLRE_14g612750v5 [Chlamydomonas reinhardtii]PNW72945.1 hypothetical protein CHLRE_14g612750v5 [Chlamydomonas reinhardtii]
MSPNAGPRSSNQSPLRPGSSLVAYQPNGGTSPKTPGGGRGQTANSTMKSSHLQQIKSLGLLHDLQDYIASVESLAAEQKKELERVKEEKRDMEKFMARAEAHAERQSGGTALDFTVSEVADLPPRMRALVEDNRGLRDTVKNYKKRNQTLEHTVTQQQNQVLALSEANERLKAQLAECSRTPAEVEREEALKKQLELKTRQVETLEHSLGVLRSKVDTDSRLYRQNLSAAAREKDALKRQLVASAKSLEEKDKDLRALQLELRKTKRGAPPTRGGVAAGTYRLPGGGGAGSDEAGTGAGAAAAPAAEPEERIRIMLMIVRDEIPVPYEVRVEVPVPYEVRVEVPVEVRVEVPVPMPMPAAPEPAQEPEPEQETQAEPEPAAEPEAAPEPDAAPEAAPEPEAETSSAPQQEEQPEALAEGAAEGEGAADAEGEPSAPELKDEDMVPAGAWPSSGGQDASSEAVEGAEGAEAAEPPAAAVEAAEGAEAAEAAVAAAEGEPEAESAPAGEGEEGEAAGQNADAGPPMEHSSQPMPVPYSRTAARALATRVGGTSGGKQPHPPVGSVSGASSHRKPSASSTASASSGKGKPQK